MNPAELAPRHQSEPLDVIVTGLPSDAHTWNLVYIQLLLEDMGHRVVNLGSCVPQDEIIESCVTLRPDLLVVSSVNGHGGHDGRLLIEAVRSRWELAGLPAVIGGKLAVTDDGGRERALELTRAGFDAVFQDGVDFVSFAGFVGSVPARAVTR